MTSLSAEDVMGRRCANRCARLSHIRMGAAGWLKIGRTVDRPGRGASAVEPRERVRDRVREDQRPELAAAKVEAAQHQPRGHEVRERTPAVMEVAEHPHERARADRHDGTVLGSDVITYPAPSVSSSAGVATPITRAASQVRIFGVGGKRHLPK